MARTCGKCRRVVRYDENLTSQFIVGWGGGQVCEVCWAEECGLPAPEPVRYPVGQPVPRMPGSDADIPICGLCRVALTEDQARGKPMRIRPEMLGPDDTVEPGGYSACPACHAEWKPRILHYLQRLCRTCNDLDCVLPDHTRAMPETATVRQVVGNWLL